MKRYNSQNQGKSNHSILENQDNKNNQNQQKSEQSQPKIPYFESFLSNYLNQSRQNNQNIHNHHHNSSQVQSHQTCTNYSCSSGMISSLFTVLNAQTQSLESLNNKVEEITSKNRQLNKRILQLQEQNLLLKAESSKTKNIDIKQIQIGSRQQPLLKIEGNSINKESLVQILFGKHNYEYNLVLSQPLASPLYRERNFNINIQLVDINGNKIKNSNKIPMSLAIYTYEFPPKFIQKNTLGQKLLKGYIDQALIQGICRFQKVQIRQVTSHYRGGWIFLVVIPCMTPLGTLKCQSYIDFTKIKPLVIQQVVVKAKKPKKKDLKKDQNEQDFDDEE